jgi:hypothetical protein
MDGEILGTFSSNSCGSLQLEARSALLLAAHSCTQLAVCSLAVASGVHSEVLGTLKLTVCLSSKELEPFRCIALGHATSLSITGCTLRLGAETGLRISGQEQAFVTCKLGRAIIGSACICGAKLDKSIAAFLLAALSVCDLAGRPGTKGSR